MTRYRVSAKISDKPGTVEFSRRLERQGLLSAKGKVFTPTGFGFLLFGEKPREVIHQAGLNVTIEYPDGKHEIENFDGPAILIPGLVEDWLASRLPRTIDRSRMERRERAALPLELVREAVINALVHRDYDIAGATCQLEVTPDTICVRSPGAPLPPVTVDQLQAFSAQMYNRNPKLQFAFMGAKLVEGRGLGMKTFRAAAEKHGLPSPKFTFDGVYLNLTIYRHVRAAVAALGSKLLDALSADEKIGWEYLVTRASVKRVEYEKYMNIDKRTAHRHLQRFIKLKLLRKVGASTSTEYKVQKP